MGGYECMGWMDSGIDTVDTDRYRYIDGCMDGEIYS